MNELIHIGQTYIAGTEVNTVNARDLHGKLGVEKDFSDWIKAQIKRAMLMEGRDFIIVTPEKGNQIGRGGDRRSKDYFLTIDAGKHVAMLSGTVGGYKIREYFIEFEKRHSAPVDPLTQLAHAVITAQQVIAQKDAQINLLESKIEEDAPKVNFMDNVFESTNSIPVTNFGRMMKSCGFTKLGYQKIQPLLSELGYLQQHSRLPYTYYIDRGWFQVKRSKPDARNKTYSVTHISPLQV